MFDNLYDTQTGQEYLRALGAFSHPSRLNNQAELRTFLLKVMYVMEAQSLAFSSDQEVRQLASLCSGWGYGPISTGGKDAVAEALAKAIWNADARAINGAPFGAWGEESARKAKSCGMLLKSQFLTADTGGSGAVQACSHFLARKDSSTWWFAGFTVRSAQNLPSNSEQMQNARQESSDQSAPRKPCYAKNCTQAATQKCKGCDRYSCEQHMKDGLCMPCQAKAILGGMRTIDLG